MVKKNTTFKLLIVLLSVCFAAVTLVSCNGLNGGVKNSSSPSISSPEEEVSVSEPDEQDPDASSVEDPTGSDEQDPTASSGEDSTGSDEQDPTTSSGEDSTGSDEQDPNGSGSSEQPTTGGANPPSNPSEEENYSAH